MKYKCIIFDCDGVLVDSEEISNRVLIEMANDFGIEIDKTYASKNFGGRSLKSILRHIENMMEGTLPEAFEKEFRQRTFEAFQKDLKPVEGIHALLDKLTLPICVASSGPMEKIRLNLTSTNLISRFEQNIFSSYEIGSWKPRPEIFEHAAKCMGFRPQECVVIEDSIAGIQAAKKGGFDVYGFATAATEQEFVNEGAIPFFNMAQLYNLLSA